MGFLLTCAVILVTVFVKSGDAIQCYNCTGDAGIPNVPATGQNCLDPFNAGPTETAECSRCSAFSFNGGGITQVERGCASAEGCPPSATCIDQQDPQTGASGRICSYCCDEETCNDQALEDAAAGGTNCWHCQVNITDSTEVTSGSCASDEFTSGTPPDVMPYPCQGMCIIADLPAGVMGPGTPASFIRTCDPFNLCAPGGPPAGYENVNFKCCEGDMCNVGGIDEGEPAEGGDSTTPKPSGGSKIAIHFATVFSCLFAFVFIAFY